MTPTADFPNESPDAMEQNTMRRSVTPYTLLRPNLSPSQPKKSWPAKVPQREAAVTASDTLGGNVPGEDDDR